MRRTAKKQAKRRTTKKQVALSPAEELKMIRQKLNHFTYRKRQRFYLKVNSEVDATLGNPKRGLVFGRIVELFGMESEGKTLNAIDIVAASQNPDNLRKVVDGKIVKCDESALVIWIDAEASADKKWFRTRGVNTDQVAWIEPYVGIFGKKVKKDKKGNVKSKPDLIDAEKLCEEAEELIKVWHQKYPTRPILVVLDSVTALLTKGEKAAGIDKQNMKTKLSLPAFLGQLFRRWVAFFQTHNVLFIGINQLRINPGQMFGNPEYVPGGKALKFYAHVRARVKRVAGGRMLQGGKQIGIKGKITNVKNKVGGVERTECGFKAKYLGTTTYLNAATLKKEGRDHEEE